MCTAVNIVWVELYRVRMHRRSVEREIVAESRELGRKVSNILIRRKRKSVSSTVMWLKNHEWNEGYTRVHSV